ncbi:MAG: RDD family protein, partial [Acidimicrobiia bacterium]|nr:RDD family protein [Acidimicrobiia bacterium]
PGGGAGGGPAAGPGGSAGRAYGGGPGARDAAVLFVLFIPLVIAEAAIRSAAGLQTEESDGLTTVMGLAILAIVGLYDPVCTKVFGASVGKRLLGLRVERVSGGPAELLRITGRWFVVVLLLGVCCLLGVFSMAAARNQRLRQAWQDKAADTIVVRATADRAEPPDATEPVKQPLPEPWATLVGEATAASARFEQTAAAAADGPVKDRLERVRAQVQACVADCERLARRGAKVAGLAAAVDLAAVEKRAQAAEADAAARPQDRDAEALAAAVRNEANSAHHLTELVGTSERRLRLAVAQLNDAVNQSAQVVFEASNSARFDHLVDEFTALRAALAETAADLGPDGSPGAAGIGEGTDP